MNICTAIYFMYFYLRHHVTKINVIKANLNVIQNFFILLSIYEKLPLRTRGTSVAQACGPKRVKNVVAVVVVIFLEHNGLCRQARNRSQSR